MLAIGCFSIYIVYSIWNYVIHVHTILAPVLSRLDWKTVRISFWQCTHKRKKTEGKMSSNNSSNNNDNENNNNNNSDVNAQQQFLTDQDANHLPLPLDQVLEKYLFKSRGLPSWGCWVAVRQRKQGEINLSWLNGSLDINGHVRARRMNFDFTGHVSKQLGSWLVGDSDAGTQLSRPLLSSR